MVFYRDLKGQSWLFPPNIRDMILDEHICHLVDLVIDGIDLSYLESKYEGPGHPAYPPKAMLKILIMAAIDGIRSSRKIARLAWENVVYMYLAGLLKPDFRTISDFRKNYSEEIRRAFKEVVMLAKSIGMVHLGHISIDGSKVKANASNYGVIKREELEDMERFIKEELRKGAEEDEREDEIYGRDETGCELPKEVDEKKMVSKIKERFKKGDDAEKERLAKLVEKAKKEVEQGKDVVSLTDPESRFMKNKGRFELSYNTQITADSSHGIIIACDVTQEQADNDQLKPQIEQAKENVGANLSGTEASADNGYFSITNIAYLAENGIDGYMQDQELAMRMKGRRKRDKTYPKEMFRYDRDKDCFVCPEGKRLTFGYEYFDKQREVMVRVYRAGNVECKKCSSRERCTRNKKGRTIKSRGDEILRIEMAQKMRSSAGKEKYKLRKQVETPFGDVKQNLGLREFLTRGIKPVKTEFKLACTAHNLKRIWNYLNAEIRVGSRARGLFFGMHRWSLFYSFTVILF